MRILIDECLDWRLCRVLTEHDCASVNQIVDPEDYSSRAGYTRRSRIVIWFVLFVPFFVANRVLAQLRRGGRRGSRSLRASWRC